MNPFNVSSFTLAEQKCVDLMFAFYQMHKLAEAKQILCVYENTNIDSICMHIEIQFQTFYLYGLYLDQLCVW